MGTNKEEVKKAVVSELENGMTLKDAAIYCGISRATLLRWRHEDEAFEAKIKKAKITYKRSLIRCVNIRSIEDGRLALEMLARKWPDEYAEKRQVEFIIDPEKEIRRIIETIRGIRPFAVEETGKSDDNKILYLPAPREGAIQGDRG